MKNKQQNQIEMIVENVIRHLISEKKLTSFEEYKLDYPNGNFNASDMTPEKLAEWCTQGDFFYVYKGIKGLTIMAANTKSIVSQIVADLYNCYRIQPTHEIDYLFEGRREQEFLNYYVCVFKLIGVEDGDYYIVYQEPKDYTEF